MHTLFEAVDADASGEIDKIEFISAITVREFGFRVEVIGLR